LSYGQKYKGDVVPHAEYDASHGLFLILIFLDCFSMHHQKHISVLVIQVSISNPQASPKSFPNFRCCHIHKLS